MPIGDPSPDGKSLQILNRAKTEHVAFYLQHLIDTTHSQNAVDSAIYTIQWAHTMAGIPSPTNSPIILATRGAAKR